jgi:hypothetical protein
MKFEHVLFALPLAGLIFVSPGDVAEAGWLGANPSAIEPTASASRQLLEIKKKKKQRNNNDDNNSHNQDSNSTSENGGTNKGQDRFSVGTDVVPPANKVQDRFSVGTDVVPSGQ